MSYPDVAPHFRYRSSPDVLGIGLLIVALIQLSAPPSIWLGGRWGQWVGILSAASNIAA